MKKPATLFIMAALIFLVTGCDKMHEKRFSTTIYQDFLVDITNDDSLVIDLSGAITSLTNTELAKVKDEIKRYELVSIDYQVFAFNGTTPNTLNGTVGFGNANSTTPGVTYEFAELDIKANNDNNRRTTMNLNSLDIKSIEQYFMDTNGLKVYLNGHVSDKPVYFTLQFRVNIDAIAEVKKK